MYKKSKVFLFTPSTHIEHRQRRDCVYIKAFWMNISNMIFSFSPNFLLPLQYAFIYIFLPSSLWLSHTFTSAHHRINTFIWHYDSPFLIFSSSSLIISKNPPYAHKYIEENIAFRSIMKWEFMRYLYIFFYSGLDSPSASFFIIQGHESHL